MGNFLSIIEKRRSIYTISKESPLTQDELQELAGHILEQMPSAFNSQSSRMVILFDGQHDKLWNIVMETLRQRIPEGKFEPTRNKIEGFKAGYATILFFDDTSITRDFAEKFQTYREHFGEWAQQSNGMLQFAVWVALEEQGYGVNLQHYNPLIDEQVSEQFQIPSSWKLIAQMPFGKKDGEANEKTTIPVSERMLVRK